MKLPKSESKLLDFTRETIATCVYSQEARATGCTQAMALYEKGSSDERVSLYNRTGIHIDRMASYLYAPGEVRYGIMFEATDGEPWLARAKVASKYLSRIYRKANADILFSQGVKIGTIKGCSIFKHNWTNKPDPLHNVFAPELVQPEFFGVEREDLGNLDEQQAMVHTTYMGIEQLKRMAGGDAETIRQLDRIASRIRKTETRENWLHQVVLGGLQPIALVTPSGMTGQSSVTASAAVEFRPEMMNDLLRVDELWVIDDEREDYTTIQLIEGEILLEGRLRHRNLSGIKGVHPFSKICPSPIPGYFWGRSEALRVQPLQDMLTERMIDIRRLLKLQAKPPKGLIGFDGMSSQKLRAAMAPGGYLQTQNPGAKIENLIGTIPTELFKDVDDICAMFDEVGGFKPITQGQGEPGVRANAHAQTLLRTASPSLRERALNIERDAEESADITLHLLQAKEATVFHTEKKEKILLKQLPEDWYCEVDSHSASPAFTDDAREMAFALRKVGAISNEDLIRMIHPPMEDQLIAASREREKAKQEFIAQHPELLEKGGKKKAAA